MLFTLKDVDSIPALQPLTVKEEKGSEPERKGLARTRTSSACTRRDRVLNVHKVRFPSQK
jgi:hypothetical protein